MIDTKLMVPYGTKFTIGYRHPDNSSIEGVYTILQSSHNSRVLLTWVDENGETETTSFLKSSVNENINNGTWRIYSGEEFIPITIQYT